MSYRGLKPAIVLLVVALLGTVALFSVNITRLFSGDGTAPFRSDLRYILSTMVLIAAIWIAVRVVLNVVDRLERGQERLLAMLRDHTADTGAIPRIRIVGTAAVAAAIAAPDPRVVDIGERIARKITEN